MRNVDDGQRIGAFEDEDAAGRNRAKRLLGAQHRLRAFQAAQIEHRLAGLTGRAHRRARQENGRATRMSARSATNVLTIAGRPRTARSEGLSSPSPCDMKEM